MKTGYHAKQKFDKINIETRKFHSSREIIVTNDVYIDSILVLNYFFFRQKMFEVFVGYNRHNDIYGYNNSYYINGYAKRFEEIKRKIFIFEEEPKNKYGVDLKILSKRF